ncbi:TorF family putative porin [Alkanindiges sp. WGS2144]|uniref:TorF family putative porin n=1 Tax=Alkanindiges sp. WGS2144 TaxID=3366808 RepID=UPI00374FEFC7
MKALTITAAFLSVGILTTQAVQAADVLTLPGLSTTGNISLSTDYRFRGVSRTSNNPAIQGAINFNHESGAYASLWGSNVSEPSSAELDAVLGYATRLSLLRNVESRLDVGYIRYIFAGSGNSAVDSNQPDFNELFARLGFAQALVTNDTLGLGVNYSSSYYQHSDDFWYLSASYAVPLAETGFGLVASLGYNQFKNARMLNRALNATGNDDHYTDYKLGTTFGVQGLNAELAWVGNTLSTSRCADAQTCKNSLQLSVSKAF